MTSPTMSCRASSPYSHHQPVTRARTAPAPTVAWRKRGARTSTTSLSAYGSAVRRERTVVEDIAGPSWGARRAGGARPGRSGGRDEEGARRPAGPATGAGHHAPMVEGAVPGQPDAHDGHAGTVPDPPAPVNRPAGRAAGRSAAPGRPGTRPPPADRARPRPSARSARPAPPA